MHATCSEGRTLYAYLDSEDRWRVRPWADTRSHRRQPTMSAFRLLLWLVWGPPPTPKHQACHFACDNHRCMNPAHGRWGTHRDNAREHVALSRFKATVGALPRHLRNKFSAIVHPVRTLLRRQGFWD
jgi:hypothetical protein